MNLDKNPQVKREPNESWTSVANETMLMYNVYSKTFLFLTERLIYEINIKNKENYRTYWKCFIFKTDMLNSIHDSRFVQNETKIIS